LIEVDVTRARRFLREHKAQTGESLSFTAFIITCLAHAIDENKSLHACRKGSKYLVLFDEVDVATQIEREVAGHKQNITYIIRAANTKTFREIHYEPTHHRQVETAYRQCPIPGIAYHATGLSRCAELHRDYSLKPDNQVSILSLQGRVIVSYTGYDKHVTLIRQGARIGAAKLWYDKPRKQFYLLVSLELEVADPTPEQHTQVVGVDVGVRYLAVTSTTKGEPSFHSGKQVIPKANHYARLRKRLQKKGTRSATRRSGHHQWTRETGDRKTLIMSSASASSNSTHIASSAWST
jgi:hypothetical protein